MYSEALNEDGHEYDKGDTHKQNRPPEKKGLGNQNHGSQNWVITAPSVGTILAYLETTAQILFQK